MKEGDVRPRSARILLFATSIDHMFRTALDGGPFGDVA